MSRTYKVLLVEDDPDLREIMVEMLLSLGLDVKTASDGEDAMNQLKGISVDAILSDERMPRMSGSELLKRVRAGDKNLPFFIMTGFSSVSRQDLLAAGANAVYEKPLDVRKFLSALSQIAP